MMSGVRHPPTDVPDAGAPSTSFRQRFGRVGGRLRPGVSGFWGWWTEALASWLPLRVRALFGLAHERVLLQHDAGSLRLSLERGEDSTAIGQFPWIADAAAPDPLAGLLAQRIADLPRWLLLPASAGLRRTLALPLAAADRLRDVVAFEIDRQTPFAAADVQYDARVTGRRGAQIDVELVVVPRATLDAALAALQPIGATLAGVDVAGSDGRALGINLLADGRRHRRSDPWRTWNRILALVAVLALAAGLWQILDNRRTVAETFGREAEQSAVQARGVAAEKRQLVDLVEGMRFLQQTRAGRPTTVEVLDELSRRLPDSTYLEKLSIEDNRMLLIGQSSEAPALIARLEGSKLWRTPALTGALQPDPRSRRDRFTLTAELVIAAGSGQQQAGNGDARNTP